VPKEGIEKRERRKGEGSCAIGKKDAIRKASGGVEARKDVLNGTNGKEENMAKKDESVFNPDEGLGSSSTRLGRNELPRPRTDFLTKSIPEGGRKGGDGKGENFPSATTQTQTPPPRGNYQETGKTNPRKATERGGATEKKVKRGRRQSPN